MKKLFYGIGFILIVFIALAVTKPDEANFKSWMKTEYQDKSNDNMLGKIFKKSVELQANYNVIYEDNIVFSKAKTSMYGENVEFIGVLSTWIPIGN